MAPVAWPSPSRCVSERSPKQQLRGSRESEETRPPAREHCTGLPADHAYGIVPPKKLRGLRGTVIILRDRADAVTAGVLTKELFFFFLIPPAREHCTGLPADHAYYTAALQLVAYLGGARRRN